MLQHHPDSQPTTTFQSQSLPALPYGHLHPFSLQILHPKKSRGLHFFGSRFIVLPESNDRQSIRRVRGEVWYGPANMPPDETNLLSDPGAALQRYGVLRDNVRHYVLVFSRSAWAFKSSETDFLKRR